MAAIEVAGKFMNDMNFLTTLVNDELGESWGSGNHTMLLTLFL